MNTRKPSRIRSRVTPLNRLRGGTYVPRGIAHLTIKDQHTDGTGGDDVSVGAGEGTAGRRGRPSGSRPGGQPCADRL